jgi:hypothetical protein
MAWDPKRFFDTVTFYDALPGASTLRQWGEQLQSWVGLTSMDSNTVDTPNVVVAGLDPEQEKDLARWFRAKGWQVLGWGGLADPDSDLPKLDPETLRQHPGIQAVISGPAIPVDLLDWAGQVWRDQPARIVFDFSRPTEKLKSLWGSVDDVVMGGVSQSGLQWLPDMSLFAGVVSTANSGGFASIRTRTVEPPLDLSAYQGLTLRVQGDGKRYKVFLRTDPGWDSLAYAHSFDTIPGQWLTVEIPFAQMMPLFRAKTIADAPPLDPSRIRSVQLMLSKFEQDKALNPFFAPGPFALQLSWIGAYGGRAVPRWILITASPSALDLEPGLDRSGIRYQKVNGGDSDWLEQVGSFLS